MPAAFPLDCRAPRSVPNAASPNERRWPGTPQEDGGRPAFLGCLAPTLPPSLMCLPSWDSCFGPGGGRGGDSSGITASTPPPSAVQLASTSTQLDQQHQAQHSAGGEQCSGHSAEGACSLPAGLASFPGAVEELEEGWHGQLTAVHFAAVPHDTPEVTAAGRAPAWEWHAAPGVQLGSHGAGSPWSWEALSEVQRDVLLQRDQGEGGAEAGAPAAEWHAVVQRGAGIPELAAFQGCVEEMEEDWHEQLVAAQWASLSAAAHTLAASAAQSKPAWEVMSDVQRNARIQQDALAQQDVAAQQGAVAQQDAHQDAQRDAPAQQDAQQDAHQGAQQGAPAQQDAQQDAQQGATAQQGAEEDEQLQSARGAGGSPEMGAFPGCVEELEELAGQAVRMDASAAATHAHAATAGQAPAWDWQPATAQLEQQQRPPASHTAGRAPAWQWQPAGDAPGSALLATGSPQGQTLASDGSARPPTQPLIEGAAAGALQRDRGEALHEQQQEQEQGSYAAATGPLSLEQWLAELHSSEAAAAPQPHLQQEQQQTHNRCPAASAAAVLALACAALAWRWAVGPAARLAGAHQQPQAAGSALEQVPGGTPALHAGPRLNGRGVRSSAAAVATPAAPAVASPPAGPSHGRAAARAAPAPPHAGPLRGHAVEGSSEDDVTDYLWLRFDHLVPRTKPHSPEPAASNPVTYHWCVCVCVCLGPDWACCPVLLKCSCLPHCSWSGCIAAGCFAAS